MRALREAIKVTSKSGVLLITGRHQVGRLIPSSVLSRLIFHALKYGSAAVELADPIFIQGHRQSHFILKRSSEAS
jgi:hypothetical protein